MYNSKMKYCFEMYEIIEGKKNKFLGYKTIIANSTEQAFLSAKESCDEEVTLAQIWVPQDA